MENDKRSISELAFSKLIRIVAEANGDWISNHDDDSEPKWQPVFYIPPIKIKKGELSEFSLLHLTESRRFSNIPGCISYKTKEIAYRTVKDNIDLYRQFYTNK